MKELEKFSDKDLMDELLRREGANFLYRVGDKVHWVENVKNSFERTYREGVITNRYGRPPKYSIRTEVFNVPEHKLHHS